MIRTILYFDTNNYYYYLHTYQRGDYMQNYLYKNMCILCLDIIVVSKIAKYVTIDKIKFLSQYRIKNNCMKKKTMFCTIVQIKKHDLATMNKTFCIIVSRYQDRGRGC